jgi:thiol:disulfide interchange protein
MNHIKRALRASVYLLLSASCIMLPAGIITRQQTIDPQTVECVIEYNLEPNELVYKDNILLSVDDPSIELSDWRSSPQPVEQYIPSLRNTHAIFNKNFTLHVTATKKASSTNADAVLYLSYQTNKKRTPTEEIIPLNFPLSSQASNQASTITELPCGPLQKEIVVTPPQKGSYLSLSAWSIYVENLIRTTDFLIVQVLLIALLGLLMSFTPCIYPMIPITVGIMQGQGTRSVFYNFLHALFYSLGIATTFACLGLLAALSGTIFGMLLTNPIVVLLIVIMLIYLALSMFGLYEIKIPQFLMAQSHKHTSSVASSFIFGAISGTVASPCLSPGLALVLCIVASLGNVPLGFLLLFSFGIGLSIPLLLIGTFSSSLTMLPRAGMWMVEVKKLFGFLLLAMSFYYLKNILPHALLLWLLLIFCALSGIYYLFARSAHDTTAIKRLKNILGILFLATAMYLGLQAYYATYIAPTQEDSFWVTDYDKAVSQAEQRNKLLFIDFWAPSCSICTAIDATVLKDSAVRTALSRFVPTKLELVVTDPVIIELQKQFAIKGLPTFILYDPVTKKVVKQWGSELYNADKKLFIEQLTSYQTPL